VPTLTPTEIYNVCISVGFTPDQAVTWTAIAMAESGGNTGAHNPHGEDSRGLWQINVASGVRENTFGDLNDPYANARAAYEISHHGTDMRPWTTTHASNAGTAHDYRQFMADAQAASGGAYHGDFSGVSGYDDPNPMGGDDPGGGPGPAHAGTATLAPAPPEPDLDRDGASDAFEMSRGTNPQDPDTDHDGLTDGFELAHGIDATVVDTDHDGLSDAYEVQIGTNALAADTDGDGVGDAEEVALGRDAAHGIANLDDPNVAAAAELDSDQDGLSDAYEAALGTDIHLADTDGDHLSDALEHAQGSDPLQADTDGDGILDDVDIDDHTIVGGLASIGGPGVGGGLGGASPFAMPVVADPLAPDGHPAPAADPGAPDGHSLTTQFLDAALAQTGDSYVFGAEASPDDPNPTTFDCSELTQWAAHHVGIDLPDGSWQQYLQLKEAGAVIPVDQAVHTPGALLFRFDQEPTAGGGRPGQAHVAISLGDGTTIEARGRAYGVGSWDAGDRFTYAAVIPGLGDAPDLDLDGDGVPDPVAAAVTAPPEPVVDTDGDGAPDPYEMANGTNPQLADSDGDGLTDGFELSHGLNPLSMDSDMDGLSDAFEVQAGLNPMDPDADHDGFTDAYELAHLAAGGADPIAVGMAGVGQGAVGLDSDHDGLSDAWESSLGTNPLHEDTDGDLISDAMEEAHGTDPLVPDHHDADDNDFDAPEP
jgi:cell wall-associated NlpC family hydrolase